MPLERPSFAGNPNRLRRAAVYSVVGGLLIALTWFIVTDAFDGWANFGTAENAEKRPPIAEKPEVSSDTKALLEPYQSKPRPPAANGMPEETAPASHAPMPDFAPHFKDITEALRGIHANLEILNKAHEKPVHSPTKSTPAPKGDTAAEREAKRKAAEKAYEEKIQKAKEWKPQMLDGEPQKESSGTVHRLKTPYALAPGTLINVVTEAQISNETKGPFRAFVSLPVCDSATHSHVVIPQMAWFMMEPTGQTIVGDTRLAITAHTLTFPNGNYLKLSEVAVGDQTGTAGLTDKVDRHHARTLLFGLFTSVLKAGSSVVAYGAEGAAERVTGAVATETASRGAQEVRQFLRTEPTITVRSGYEGTVYLRDELPLAEPYAVDAAGTLACGGTRLGG